MIHVAGMGESHLDMIISEFEKLSNPTVGLLAKPGQVDIRVAAKANTIKSADKMISETIDDIKLLLGDNIYGYDGDLLIDGLAKIIPSGRNICIIEFGFNGTLSSYFNELSELPLQSKRIDGILFSGELEEMMIRHSEDRSDHFIVGCSFDQKEGISMLECNILDQGKMTRNCRKFGGPPENGVQWAINLILDILRRYFISREIEKENL